MCCTQMARRLLAVDEFGDDAHDLLTDQAMGDGSNDVDSDGGGLAAALSLQDKVAEQHTAVHAFHHHIPHGTRHSSSGGTGIIWLLIILHVAFVGYWTWFWWTSRKQREEKKGKSSVPQKVGCVYDFVVPPISSIQLASKPAQH